MASEKGYHSKCWLELLQLSVTSEDLSTIGMHINNYRAVCSIGD